MNKLEIKLPKLGESIVSASIVSIYKKEGNSIKKDETLMEVSTDKINSEIPSPYEGKISKILVEVGQKVMVGDVIAIVESVEDPDLLEPHISKNEEASLLSDKKSFSPSILRLAKVNNIEINELEEIQGTGENGRVTKKDFENYLLNKKTLKLKTTPLKSELKVTYKDLSSRRKAIASGLEKSYKIPHAYLIDEIDVTDLLNLIKEKKQKFFDKNSIKLTITSFLAKAIAIAAKKYPLVNSSYSPDRIIIYDDINLAIAVNVDDDVIVPCIKKANDLSILELSKEINLLAKKARSNSLENSDLLNSTITLTNFGMANVKIGLPIINGNQSAIIAIGTIDKKLNIENTKDVRSFINVSLAFDHRIFDGIYGCKFINEIKNYLEKTYERSF